MGQYWQVASPDQRQQLSTLVWAKLGEILPSGHAGHYLQFQLMAPLHKQQSFLQKAEINSKLRAYLVRLEAIANTEAEAMQTEDEAMQTEDNTVQFEEDQPSLLSKIYESTWLSKKDICVGDFTDKRDMSSLVKLIFDNLLGSWADQRVVCVGDYAETIPPEYGSKSGTLYNNGYTEVLSLHSCAKEFFEGLKCHCPQHAETFRLEYSRRFEKSFPSNQQHVLLNLTSKEYVLCRRDVRISGKELDQDQDARVWGLGDAVISRICWSQDPSISMETYDGCWDVEGPWAGHRFAIVSVSVFDKVTKGRKGWKDASGDVYKVLANIWKY